MPGTPDDIRAELGIALDEPVYTIRITSPGNRSGYTYECVGVPMWLSGGTLQLDAKYSYKITRIPPSETPPPEEVPLFFFGIPGFPSCLFALRRRVYRDGCPVYLEARWTPTGGETIEPKEVGKGTPQTIMPRVRQAAALLEEGIPLLRAIEEAIRRRPEKPVGFESYEEAITVIVDIVRQLKKDGKPHRQQDVAHYLLYSTDRFPVSNTRNANEDHAARRLRNYCQHEGLTWEDIERMAGD